jgi:hypothetical protein
MPDHRRQVGQVHDRKPDHPGRALGKRAYGSARISSAPARGSRGRVLIHYQGRGQSLHVGHNQSGSTFPSGVLVPGMASWIDYWPQLSETLTQQAAVAARHRGDHLRGWPLRGDRSKSILRTASGACIPRRPAGRPLRDGPWRRWRSGGLMMSRAARSPESYGRGRPLDAPPW